MPAQQEDALSSVGLESGDFMFTQCQAPEPFSSLTDIHMNFLRPLEQLWVYCGVTKKGT